MEPEPESTLGARVYTRSQSLYCWSQSLSWIWDFFGIGSRGLDLGLGLDNNLNCVSPLFCYLEMFLLTFTLPYILPFDALFDPFFII